MVEKRVGLFHCFWQFLLTKKHHKKTTKNGVLRDESDEKFTVSGKFYWQKNMQQNDVLRNRIIFLIKVENFDYSLSQSETVKLIESDGKFTISSKIYWQKNIPKMQQKWFIKEWNYFFN